MPGHSMSSVELQQSISSLWTHIYHTFPNVTYITTPFWPQYSRTQTHADLARYPPGKAFSPSLLPEEEQKHLQELQHILSTGFVGSPDPSFQEAKSYQELTCQAYDEHATDYQAAVIQHSPLEEALNEFVALSHPNGTILDVGCGPGHDMQRFLERGRSVVGVDASSVMVRLSRNVTHAPVYQLDMLSLDSAHLPYVYRPISGIWCVATLLHLWRSDVPLALHNFYHVLQPSGCLFLSVKQGSGSTLVRREKTGGSPRFFTYFALEELRHYLKTIGFEMQHFSQYAIYRPKIGWDVWINMLVRKPGNSLLPPFAFPGCQPQKPVD